MSTIKISELATSNIALTDFFAKADATGLASKNTIQNLSTFFETVGEVGFKGSLAIADTPTVDGWYIATENGTYTNAGSIVVTLLNTFNIIIVSSTQTVFELIEVPLTITVDGIIESGNTNAVSGGNVFNTTYKKSDLVAGKNKFDKNISVDGFRVTNGAVIASATSTYSDYMPVSESEQYISIGTMRYTSYYDSDKVYVAGGGSSLTSFTVPVGVSFVIVTIYTTSKDTFQLETGTVSTTYEPYLPLVSQSQIRNTIKIYSEHINIADFGAIGDDSTDNTQSFIDARDKALLLGVKKIFIPEGVFLTEQIDFLTTDNSLNNFVIEGIGWQSEIKLKALTLAGKNSVINFIGDGINIEGVKISNLCINGNESAHTGTRTVDMEGINLERCVNSSIENVFLKNCVSDGVDIDNGINFTVKNCYSYNCGGHGIHVSLSSRKTRIESNTVENCGVFFQRAGIDQFQTASDSMYIGNTSINNYRNYDISGDGATFLGNKSFSGANTVLKDNLIGVGRTLQSINPIGAGNVFSLLMSNDVEFDIIDVSSPNIEETTSGSSTISKSYRNTFLETGASIGSAKLRIAGGYALSVGVTYNNTDLSRATLIQLTLTNSGSRNGISRFSYCKANADGVGDLVRLGYGFKIVNNALFGTLHNGTTYYEIDLTTTIESQPKQVNIFSNGDGNISFIVDGEVKGTSLNAPTGLTGSNNNSIQFEVENADGISQMGLRVHSLKIAVANSN